MICEVWIDRCVLTDLRRLGLTFVCAGHRQS